MATKQNFGAPLADKEALKEIARLLGFVQTRGPERGQGSIRAMLDAISAGKAVVVLSDHLETSKQMVDTAKYLTNQADASIMLKIDKTLRRYANALGIAASQMIELKE